MIHGRSDENHCIYKPLWNHHIFSLHLPSLQKKSKRKNLTFENQPNTTQLNSTQNFSHRLTLTAEKV